MYETGARQQGCRGESGSNLVPHYADRKGKRYDIDDHQIGEAPFTPLIFVLLLANFLPGPVFADSCYQACRKTGMETSSNEDPNQYCSYKGDGNRGGNLDLAHFESVGRYLQKGVQP